MNMFMLNCEALQVKIPELDIKLQALADAGYITTAELWIIYRAIDQACKENK